MKSFHELVVETNQFRTGLVLSSEYSTIRPVLSSPGVAALSPTLALVVSLIRWPPRLLLITPPLLAIDKASIAYEPGKPILRNLDLRLDPDDRIGLLGANGNGKTTLARFIAGELQAASGEIHRAAKLRVGYVAQHHADELDPNDTAVDHLTRRLKGQAVDRVRARLGSVGLTQDKQTTRVGALSGG